MKYCKYGYFTLVELLVVISVFALLISLLNPSLKKVLMASHSIKCQNNQKILGQYASNYIDDHDNHTSLSSGTRWDINLAVYAEIENYAVDPKHDPELRFSELLCPQTDIDGDYQAVYGNWAFIGTSATAWKAARVSGSYGVNLWVTKSFSGIFKDDTDNFAETIFDVKSPSTTPLLGDSIWYRSWPEKNDLFPTDVNLGFQQHQKRYFMGRFAIGVYCPAG
jgi:prepilin-type N-terminal cleavage/methylation domain-containing protein